MLLNIIVVLMLSCNEPAKDQNQKVKQVSKDQNGNLQKADPSANTGIPQTVSDIQKEYANTLQQLERGSLDSTAYKYSCQGEKGGSVIHYLEKGKLKLIVHRYHEYDHYTAVDRYFVKDSTLFFIFQSTTTWAFEDGGGTKDHVTENRIYLAKNQPFSCLEKSYDIRSKETTPPKPAAIPNKEADCSGKTKVVKAYQDLLANKTGRAPGCKIDQ